MNTEPIKHATFIVERTYPADAARIFRAFSDTDVKRRWFAEGEDWRVEEFTADFRPGGYETSRFRYADGPPITYDTRYLDIITDERLVFSYTITIDGRPSSVSLASVELFPAQGGTASSTPSRGSTSRAVTRRSSARSAAANCTTPSVRCWRPRTERDPGRPSDCGSLSHADPGDWVAECGAQSRAKSPLSDPFLRRRHWRRSGHIPLQDRGHIPLRFNCATPQRARKCPSAHKRSTCDIVREAQ